MFFPHNTEYDVLTDREEQTTRPSPRSYTTLESLTRSACHRWALKLYLLMNNGFKTILFNHFGGGGIPAAVVSTLQGIEDFDIVARRGACRQGLVAESLHSDISAHAGYAPTMDLPLVRIW